MLKLLVFVVLSLISSSCFADDNEKINATEPLVEISSPSTEPMKEVTPAIPIEAPELPHPSEQQPISRRKISYDQRQEGKYNIRADFENFMIVLIPPNAASGLNLLDLLSRSSSKRSSSKKANKQRQSATPKHFHKSEVSISGLQYLNRVPLPHSEIRPPAQYGEYVEGRTPYRVDISSAENDFNKFHHPEIGQQVDVIPPPYPVQLHLMKPYHLEADTTGPVLSLPQGNLPDFYHFFDHSDRRVAKAIRDHPTDFNAYNTNRVLVNGDGRGYSSNSRHTITVDSSDKDKDYDKNHIKDNIQLAVNDDDIFNSLRLKDGNSEDNINLYQTRTAGADNFVYNSNGELLLIGATEQCGPDRKRDSYGVCQFVE